MVSSEAVAARTPRRRRALKRLAVGLLVVLAIALFARERILRAAAGALTYEDTAAADYLVVLGGDAESRPFKAAELFRAGVAPRVLLFEYPAPPRRQRTQTMLYRRILEHEGVPASAIVQVPGVVRTSWEEAQSLRRYVEANPTRRVVIVTSAEHTRRARWAFRRALAPSNVDVRMAAARHQDFDESNWWRHDEGVLLYMHEFVKLPYYLLRYGVQRDAR